jgi:hypothetical protein
VALALLVVSNLQYLKFCNSTFYLQGVLLLHCGVPWPMVEVLALYWLGPGVAVVAAAVVDVADVADVLDF